MKCGELFLKGVTTTFVGYFLIVSIAFILYGLRSTYIILLTNSEDVLEHQLVSAPSMGLILSGFLLFTFLIFGCCAVCREMPCCLETYSIFLAILAVAQIALGVFSLVNFDINDGKLARSIKDEVEKMFLSYDYSPTDMDTLQYWMSCCGVLGPHEWNTGNMTIPVSCCSEGASDCNGESIASVHMDGCYKWLLHFIIETNYIIGWSLNIVAMTELIAALLGITLSCAYWRNRQIVWM